MRSHSAKSFGGESVIPSTQLINVVDDEEVEDWKINDARIRALGQREGEGLAEKLVCKTHTCHVGARRAGQFRLVQCTLRTA
jgi:hypothetical protein